MSDKKPNFLVIVADDLGFTDLGSFGGEIRTPNLDKLAESGLKFTGFHTAAACSPTRSMLLSGTDNHLAGLGQMAEYAATLSNKFKGVSGYEGYLNFKVAALGEILQPEYYTFMAGKWHLGLDEPYWPDKRGFEKSFNLLPGAGNHFKFNTSQEGFMPWLYQENGRSLDPEKELPDDFYSSDYYTTKLLEYLEDEESRKGRPFLGLLTFTAPHWPLQAHRDTIDHYRGVYAKGPLALRRSRLNKSRELGIAGGDVVPHEVETREEQTWDELSIEDKEYSSKVMEIYAAMVEEMDANIGRVISKLEQTGELDNTVVFFLSDNGACGTLLEALPFGSRVLRDSIKGLYDNSIENIGNGNSFVKYSDIWAQAATAPRYMYKMWATEGGINCPLIIRYPNFARNSQGTNIVDEFSTVMDILPTILDLADIRHPGRLFQGREVHLPRGKSWVPFLSKSSEQIHDSQAITGWELFGQRAIRQGDFKAFFIPPPFGSGEWELYDLSKDLGETRNLSAEYPEKLQEMLDYWSLYVAETGVIEVESYPPKTVYNRKVISDKDEETQDQYFPE